MAAPRLFSKIGVVESILSRTKLRKSITMPRIFISYRRDDTAFAAQAIYDKLKELLGEELTTFDVNFSLGVDFAKKIDESVCRCDVLLAIIGDRWLEMRFADGPMRGRRRLDDPNDWVRLEIASALKRDILVIPVLVGKVSISDISPELPPDLADLTKKVAISVRAGPDLPNDLQLLVRGVKRAIRLSPLTPSDLALPPGIKVVPQGLRSFDENDDGFFIYLLPGPYQKDGLPERLCFWKTRIEAADADTTFRVGLIYGPSGCGKSSLVRAGLLPRLDEHVTAVYVEATATDTEARLLAALHKHCPYLAGESSLLAALRHKDQIPSNKKVLVVLDQFEQYLHSTPEDEQDELAEALRECDGGKLQCILMVRDDFLTPVNRFMKKLDIPLAEDRNLALVDLFDRRHAKKVLALLGQAYGGLPASGSLRKEQDAFLNQAISDLSEGDHVICVRLALFAAMVKDKEWKPATLKAIGGATGVGVAFLEESFVAQTAPEENRRHKAAAQRVLNALLPEPGTSIKGASRTKQELLKMSGYARRPDQFGELLDILDKKLRLVTPTDPVSKSSDGQPEQSVDAERRYQLTHDYLVPSLRDWLTSKKRETHRGRAELRLAERSELWTAKPENRHLPSMWEYLNIRLLTDRKDWTGQQRKMMGQAGRVHGIRSGIVAAMLLVAIAVGMSVRNAVVEKQNATRAEGLVEALVNADIAKVPDIVTSLGKYRTWADPLLKAKFDQAKEGSSQRLNVAVALLPVDASQVDYLSKRLLDAAPNDVPVIRDALGPYKDELVEKLWAVVEQPAQGHEQQGLRAACALANYDPGSERWEKAKGAVADELVAVPAVHLATWMDALRAVREKLLAPLSVVFKDAKRPEIERSLATGILADYAADQPQVLADLLMDADEKQFAIIYTKLQGRDEEGLPLLQGEIKKPLPDTTEEAKEALAKRQANAAVALLRMGEPEKVWPLLKHSSDPRVRSWIIHKLSPMRANPGAIIKRLKEEPDVSIRRALILSLGEFGEQALTAGERASLLETLRELYRSDPDPGLHTAAEWLLRQWKQDEWLKQIEQEWVKNRQQREQRLQSIGKALANGKTKPQWYVTSQGQTMVVIPGPVEFLMGSSPTEPQRFDDERLHRKRIGRTFAIAAKAVTVEQFLRFCKDDYMRQYAPTADCPMHGTSWYTAAKYCNWLSKQEGLPEKEWCYEPKKDGRFDEGMKMSPDFMKRSGYRLPTESEWEYACRAEAVTSRYYGQSEELLGKYGRYTKNSGERSWPVGSLKPNDFGLFDMQGNVFTWCQDAYTNYVSGQGGQATEDIEDASPPFDKVRRVLRGGSFSSPASNVRSAYRSNLVPTSRDLNGGFRPARTYN